MKILVVKCIVLILTLMLWGCVGAQGDTNWKEEVLLHDGKKIIIERSQNYGGSSEPGQSGRGPIKEDVIRFVLPSSNRTIIWKSEYGKELGRTNFRLLAVHFLNDTPYVVAEPNLCLSYNKWGRPDPPYVFFEFSGSSWQRISIEKFPVELKTLNILQDTLGYDAQKLIVVGFVSAEKINELNSSDLPRSEYKSILRERINYDPECIEMLTNGSGLWLAAARFKKQPNLQACEQECWNYKFSNSYCPCKMIFERK